MKNEVLVKEAMKMKPVVVKPTMTVVAAARLMREKKIGNVIVVEGKHPVGILTESDILKKVVAEGKNASKIKIKSVMTSPVIVIDPYINLQQAMKIMGRCNIRRLPVVENNKLIGIITVKDIVRISPSLIEIAREWGRIKVGDEGFLKEQVFSGICEDCGTLSSTLKPIDGRILCEDCIDALKYE